MKKQYIKDLLNIMIIKNSRFFDKKYYLSNQFNNDEKITNPYKHYYYVGWKKGLNPSKKFNTNFYLETYKDVKKANICPLLHYEKYGKKEKRRTNSITKNDYRQYRIIRSIK